MKLVLLCFALAVVVVSGREGFGPGEQDWGHATVRPQAHMFWWLYYTTANVPKFTDRPLIIWLQGGPGASSTGYGNFAELGPLDVDLKPREWTWVKDANVLFIDNPVGTGWSYVESTSALTTTNQQIAEDLVEMMRQFYKQVPEFETVPLYITAESYGGKMAADFALVLDAAIKAGTIVSNLKGVGLGDSWISPIDSVMTWAPYLLQLGFVDQNGHDKIDTAAKKCQDLVNAGRWVEATNQWGTTEYVIMDVAHNVDFYNVLKNIPGRGFTPKDAIRTPAKLAKPAVRDLDDEKIDALMKGPVKIALGLTGNFGAQDGLVFNTLSGDFMKPNTDSVEKLLNSTNIKVFVFTGQLDLIVDTPGTVLWIDRLKWTQSSQWATAARNTIVVDGIIEGFRKEVGNFGLYWVNRAGHMVPADNPSAMDYILKKLTNDYSG